MFPQEPPEGDGEYTIHSLPTARRAKAKVLPGGPRGSAQPAWSPPAFLPLFAPATTASNPTGTVQPQGLRTGCSSGSEKPTYPKPLV